MKPHASRSDPEAADNANNVEAILGAVATLRGGTGERPVAHHALWLCACFSDDHGYSWLIYDNDDGLFWRRIPDGRDTDQLVDADKIAGSHLDPAGVLQWLQGAPPDPALGEVYGDAEVLTELSRKIFGQLV